MSVPCKGCRVQADAAWWAPAPLHTFLCSPHYWHRQHAKKKGCTKTGCWTQSTFITRPITDSQDVQIVPRGFQSGNGGWDILKSLGLGEGMAHQPTASKRNKWPGGKASATLSTCISHTTSATTSLCPGLGGNKTPLCGYKATMEATKRGRNSMAVIVMTNIHVILIP